MFFYEKKLAIYPYRVYNLNYEKYKEIRTLIENLQIPTIFAAMGASNAYQFHGQLPKDKKKLLSFLDEIICNVSEEELQQYRKSVHHL